MRFVGTIAIGATWIAMFAAAGQSWVGASGEYTVRCSASEFQVMSHGRRILDLKEWAKAQWLSFIREPHDQYYKADYKLYLLSFVGPILSIKASEDCDCGGVHPSRVTQFRALNLARSTLGRPVLAVLTDLFSSDDILKALLKDPAVQTSLPGLHASTLEEFGRKVRFERLRSADSDTCNFTLGAEYLSHFAVYKYVGNAVSVRLSLSDNNTCRGEMTEIGITLPVPEAWRSQFAEASSKSSGFVMSNRPSASPTSLNFAETHITLPVK